MLCLGGENESLKTRAEKRKGWVTCVHLPFFRSVREHCFTEKLIIVIFIKHKVIRVTGFIPQSKVRRPGIKLVNARLNTATTGYK